MKYRSVAPVLAGLMTLLLLVAVATMASASLMLGGDAATGGVPANPSSAYLVVNLAYSFVAAVVGGWLTARLSPDRPRLHVAVLAALMAVLSAVTMSQHPRSRPAVCAGLEPGVIAFAPAGLVRYVFGNEGSHRRPRCPSAQPQEPGPGPAAPRGDRGDGTVGVGEVFAGLRHHLCRGPAALRGVAFHLRQAVPRPHGEARRGPRRGDLSGRRHPAAQSHQDQPFHRRHRDGGVRLPAPAVGAGRPHLLPGSARRGAVRTRGKAGHGAERHRRGAGPAAGDAR